MCHTLQGPCKHGLYRFNTSPRDLHWGSLQKKAISREMPSLTAPSPCAYVLAPLPSSSQERQREAKNFFLPGSEQTVNEHGSLCQSLLPSFLLVTRRAVSGGSYSGSPWQMYFFFFLIFHTIFSFNFFVLIYLDTSIIYLDTSIIYILYLYVITGYIIWHTNMPCKLAA